MDEERVLAGLGDVDDLQAAVAAADDAPLPSAPKRIGSPAVRRIWLASRTSLSVSALKAPSLNTGQFW